jgi:hypothetical protein
VSQFKLSATFSFAMALTMSFGTFFSPRLAEARVVHCNDIKAIAKEVVESSLLGPSEPFADHSCFKGKRFEYFHPENDVAEGEITNWNRLIWFYKDKDKYTITSVTPDGPNFRIKVHFTLNGNPLDTTYIYKPNADYLKTTGSCGFIENHQHITRTDCADKKIVQPHIKQIL